MIQSFIILKKWIFPKGKQPPTEEITLLGSPTLLIGKSEHHFFHQHRRRGVNWLLVKFLGFLEQCSLWRGRLQIEWGSPVENSGAVEALRAEHDLRIGFFSSTHSVGKSAQRWLQVPAKSQTQQGWCGVAEGALDRSWSFSSLNK